MSNTNSAFTDAISLSSLQKSAQSLKPLVKRLFPDSLRYVDLQPTPESGPMLTAQYLHENFKKELTASLVNTLSAPVPTEDGTPLVVLPVFERSRWLFCVNGTAVNILTHVIVDVIDIEADNALIVGTFETTRGIYTYRASVNLWSGGYSYVARAVNPLEQDLLEGRPKVDPLGVLTGAGSLRASRAFDTLEDRKASAAKYVAEVIHAAENPTVEPLTPEQMRDLEDL